MASVFGFERMCGIGGRVGVVFVLVLVTLVSETRSDVQAADQQEALLPPS